MAKALSKSQVAAAIADKNSLSKKQAAEILDSIAELAYKNAKNTFTLPGLGKLVLVNRKARVGRNPATCSHHHALNECMHNSRRYLHIMLASAVGMNAVSPFSRK